MLAAFSSEIWALIWFWFSGHPTSSPIDTQTCALSQQLHSAIAIPVKKAITVQTGLVCG